MIILNETDYNIFWSVQLSIYNFYIFLFRQIFSMGKKAYIYL